MADEAVRPVKRRGLFAALGMGGVAAAATAVALKPAPAAAVVPQGDKAGPHYRESAHVKQFYRVNSY